MASSTLPAPLPERIVMNAVTAGHLKTQLTNNDTATTNKEQNNTQIKTPH
jgi:hypothetical protein